jgi:hypothetical protein
VSPKIMVLQPDEADRQVDDEVGRLSDALDKAIREGTTHRVQQNRWDSLVELLAALGKYEDESLAATERFVSACVAEEIHDRHHAALDAERVKDVRRALLAWDLLLSVPAALLPRQVRREALGFPARRNKLISDQRRPLLKASVSAVFLLWCLALALALIELVVLWFDEGFSLVPLQSYAIPLAVQLITVVLFSRLLANPRVLSEADPIPLRQPPLFLTGLMLLWILSPLNGVFISLCRQAGKLVQGGDLPLALAVLGKPWTAPVLVTIIWVLCDLLIAGRYRSPLVAFGMTLSWLLALGSVVLLWGLPPETALLQVAVAMYHAIIFAALQSLNYLWFRKHRGTPVLHPELNATSV